MINERNGRWEWEEKNERETLVGTKVSPANNQERRENKWSPRSIDSNFANSTIQMEIKSAQFRRTHRSVVQELERVNATLRGEFNSPFKLFRKNGEIHSQMKK